MVQTPDNSAPVGNHLVLDVAFWLDAAMLRQEASFLRHLVMALKDEGHHVSFICAHDLDLSLLPVLGSRVITYHVGRWERLGVLQRLRLSGVIEELTTRPPDVLVTWGGTDAGLISIVGQATNLPMLIWCWDATELFAPLMNLPQVRHAVVSSQPMAERVPANFRVPVSLIHPGVYGEEQQACYDVPGQVPCLVSLDPLSDLASYEALIRACWKLSEDGLEFLLFAYDQGRQEHPIWRLAEKLKLLDRVSFVPFQLDAEPLLLHGDLYLHALGSNRVRYRTLEAMGHGLAVVTRPNHAADYLVDGQTCRIVSVPTVEGWYEALGDLLTDRTKAIGLARRGQQLMREQHGIARTLSQFTWACRQAAGTPLKLTST